jgi:hypothetical protein
MENLMLEKVIISKALRVTLDVLIVDIVMLMMRKEQVVLHGGVSNAIHQKTQSTYEI